MASSRGFDPKALEAAIAELGDALEALTPRPNLKKRAIVRAKTGTGRLETPRAAATEQLADTAPPAPAAPGTRSGTGLLLEALDASAAPTLDGVTLGELAPPSD